MRLLFIVLTLLFSSPSHSQTQWSTTLGDPEVELQLNRQSAVASTSGSVFSLAMTSTGEFPRARLVKFASNGSTEWIRWIDGEVLELDVRMVAHNDGSASVGYIHSSGRFCVRNYSSTGVNRADYCISSTSVSHARMAGTPDGDLLLLSNLNATIGKYSPLGLKRWETPPSNTTYVSPIASGFDREGNYFELAGGIVQSWRLSDGLRRPDVVLFQFGSNPFYSFFDGTKALPMPGAEFVAIRNRFTTSGAVVARVARYSASGSLKWEKQIVFVGTPSETDAISLYPAGTDDVIVARTSVVSGASADVARISSAGTLIWQRPMHRVWRFVETPSGLLGIRTDPSGVGAGQNTFLIPIDVVTGTQGAVVALFNQPDGFVPNRWFSVNDGVFAGYEQAAYPNTSFPPTLTATSAFIGTANTSQWVNVAKSRPDNTIAQGGCLLPRVAQSSPSNWWGRSTTPTGSTNIGPGRWSSANNTTGAKERDAPRTPVACGYPLAGDGSQIVVSAWFDRVSRVNPNGSVAWTTSSASSPSVFGIPLVPSQHTASGGETSYAVGSIIGRAAASGTLMFETDVSLSPVQYLSVDGQGNTWVYVPGNGLANVLKISPTGSVLWNTMLDVASCYDEFKFARLLNSSELLVVSESCNEGRVFKIASDGTVAWQRIISNSATRPKVNIGAIHEDPAGNIYVGGCTGDNPGFGQSPRSVVALVASWSSPGVERFSATTDVLSGANECVGSLATDGGGNVYAAVLPSSPTGNTTLWSLTSSGTERWRHTGVLSNPAVTGVELAINGDDMVALGEVPPSEQSPRSVTLRKWSLSSLAGTLKLKVLQSPSSAVGYLEPFAIKVGLRTPEDVAVAATVDTVARVTLAAGTGRLSGTLECTIAAGATECTLAQLAYDTLETNAVVTVSADGLPIAQSAPIEFKPNPTQTTFDVIGVQSFEAYTTRRVRVRVLANAVLEASTFRGYLSGPNIASGDSLYDCREPSFPLDAVIIQECDVLLRSELFPLSASFYTGGAQPGFADSTASPYSIQIQKVASSISVTLDPSNSLVAGDRVRLRVRVLAANGVNASRFVDPAHVSVSGGVCTQKVEGGSSSDNFATSYVLCEISSAPQGTSNATVSFAGDSNLLAAAPFTQSVATAAGAVFRAISSSGSLSGVTVCSPIAGVSCSVLGQYPFEVQCSGPVGVSGPIFLVPSSSSPSYLWFGGTPLQFVGTPGVVSSSVDIRARYSSSCLLDADRDGAALATTDGVLILRRILGVAGNALIAGATHACVPLSATQIEGRVVSASYDIDGDGNVQANTDALLILRALLGFSGDALIEGAISATSTRKTAIQVIDHLRWSCGLDRE
jgi:hypothetical protein